MGFGQVAAAGILAAGVLYSIALLAQGQLNAQQELQAATDDAEARSVVSNRGSIRIDSTNWRNGPKLFDVTATNTGSVTLSISQLDVLLDGVLRTSGITNKKVEGKTTQVWPPAAELTFTVSNTNQPTHAAIATNEAVMAFWRA